MSEKPKKENKLKNIIVVIIPIIFIVAVIAGIFIYKNKESKEKQITYDKLYQDIIDKKVEKIEMIVGGSSVTVKYKDSDDEKTTKVNSLQPFMDFINEQLKSGNDLKVDLKNPSAFLTIAENIFGLLPTILIIVLMVMIFKMQGFGDKNKVYGTEDENDTGVKFKDVAGLDEEKAELVEIVDFLKEPKKFKAMGARIPRGILLYGKPGTGKTLIAKAIAGEAGVPFISMSGSEFIEMFAGLGASRVRKLFERARKISPCIVFIDEIDAIGSRRTSNSGSESENNQTLNQLLVEMDGFDTNETIIVLAATNRPEMLDKALLRPGRFDRQITIPAPDLLGRLEILKLHSKDKKLAGDVNLKDIAGDTAGFTGAELFNLLNESAIIATRNGHKEINRVDIDTAVKKITVGLEKHNRVVSEKDKKLTAFHEAGHAVVSKFLETQKNVKEISIIPRGLAGGYTMYKTNEDKFYVSKTELEEKMIALMGGRAAEKIALNDISTGASNDIEVATGIARDMITIYGMSKSLGPISLKVDEPYELQVFGENIVDEVGVEVKQLIDTAYVAAQKILLSHMSILNAVADTLMEKETISEEEFEKFFNE
ncbi:MAG: ATP-dependent zinc metalloprotease FtsH [Clostridia bacterium]|nr:ATP-dependent zinc metalloprotease FtsH [Clostridia bacterium]